jgi:hypothetical protein
MGQRDNGPRTTGLQEEGGGQSNGKKILGKKMNQPDVSGQGEKLKR